jgi:hypothetical protein
MPSYTTNSPVIKGAGVKHRKAGLHERAELAVDAVTATRPFVPSNGQAAQIFAVPPATLHEHLAARRRLNGNGGNGDDNGNGNGHATPPAPDRFARDLRLSGLIVALSNAVDVLRDLQLDDE